MPKAFVGTSGWNYKHWHGGEFYPALLKPPQWLDFFSQHFETVEINNSFYRLPSEAAFQHWRSQVPRNFIFAVKASRFLTHIKRLKDPEEPLALFFSRAKHLKDQLGPVLFQLPPQLNLNLGRLDAFLRALKSYRTKYKLRCVLEVRNSTWLVPPVYEILREHRVALCFADWRDTCITGPITADFVYVRRHAGRGAGGNYLRKDLNRDVENIRAWLNSRLDVYMYFNNDLGGHAIRNAKYVLKKLEKAEALMQARA